MFVLLHSNVSIVLMKRDQISYVCIILISWIYYKPKVFGHIY